MIMEDRLLTPDEVAARFKVRPRTVTRWAVEGKLSSIRTPGNHRRFWQSEVNALLAEPPPTRIRPTAQEGHTC